MSKLKPMLFTTMKNYSKEQLLNDVIAGLIVAIIALPLSIALAIASGVSPERGLYTAIIAGFMISFLGGTRVQIGGPSGTFLIIVYGIMIQYKLDGLILATIMAGIILIVMGLLRFGSVIKFIPYPITTGFTSGVAIIIFSSQIKDFLGLKTDTVPADFISKWRVFFTAIHTIQLETLIIGVFSLLIIIFWPKINKRIPGYLVAIFLPTIIVYIFKIDIETIGTKFGTLSTKLPKPQLPHFNSFEEFSAVTSALIRPALTIAIIASIESLLSAVVSDGVMGSKHRSNMELVAQGIANVSSGLFGGIPATGALARTAANIKNGGRTPVAGMVHALVLLLILVSFMPLVQMVPLTSLAAVLIMVSYNMSGWREFRGLFKGPKSDISVLVITFLITILVDVVRAIEIGMILAAFLFMKRMSDVSYVKTLDASEDDETEEEKLHPTSKGIQIYEINGPFFFGAADKFLEVVQGVSEPKEVIIIRMRNVPAMDATALNAFKSLITICRKHHTTILISGINDQPKSVLKKSLVYDMIGEEHFFPNIEKAIIYAEAVLINQYNS